MNKIRKEISEKEAKRLFPNQPEAQKSFVGLSMKFEVYQEEEANGLKLIVVEFPSKSIRYTRRIFIGYAKKGYFGKFE